MALPAAKQPSSSKSPTSWLYGYKVVGKDRHGNPVKSVRRSMGPVNPETQKYQSTYLYNRITGMVIIFYMTFDFDFDKADSCWKLGNKLDYYKIKDFLFQHYPGIAKNWVFLCESTSHTGFCLSFGVSPFVLGAENSEGIEKMFKEVRRGLFRIFSYHRMGADPGALMGIKRFQMNPLNEEFLVERNDPLYHQIHNHSTDFKRPRILSEMRDYLRTIPIASRGMREEWADVKAPLEVVFPNAKCRAKVENLVLDLFDEDCRMVISPKELQARYGFSKGFVYNTLANGIPRIGLSCEKGHGEWGLTLDINSEAIGLAFANYQAGKQGAKGGVTPLDYGTELDLPEAVTKGKRYAWLGKALLYLKHDSVSECEARRIMERFIPRIPGWEHSKNCRELEIKIRSIYGNKPELFGCNPGVAPDWLLNPDNLEVEARDNLYDFINKNKPTNDIQKKNEAPEAEKRPQNAEPAKPLPSKASGDFPIKLQKVSPGLRGGSLGKLLDFDGANLSRQRSVEGKNYLSIAGRQGVSGEASTVPLGDFGQREILEWHHRVAANRAVLAFEAIKNFDYLTDWCLVIDAGLKTNCKAPSLNRALANILDFSKWPHPAAGLRKDDTELAIKKLAALSVAWRLARLKSVGERSPPKKKHYRPTTGTRLTGASLTAQLSRLMAIGPPKPKNG